MPIRYIHEKRHHIGECDIGYPAFFCDICGHRIEDGSMANYHWDTNYKIEEGKFYDQQYDVKFSHCDCCNRVHSTWVRLKDHFDIESPYGIVNSMVFLRGGWDRIENFNKHLKFYSSSTGIKEHERVLKLEQGKGDK